MQSEPDIDKNSFFEAVRNKYGIVLKKMTHIPEGAISYNYKAEAENGREYFVKIYSDSPNARIFAFMTDFYLPVTWKLKYERGIKDIGAPERLKSGGFKAYFREHPFIIFEYIKGRDLGEFDDLDSEMLGKMARAVALYHKESKGMEETVPDEIAKMKDPGITEKHLKAAVNRALSAPPERKAHEILKEELELFREELEKYIKEFHYLSAAAEKIKTQKVLCHNDLHGWNIKVDEKKVPHIFDWEMSSFEPPEADIWFFIRIKNFGYFLEEYKKIYGPYELHMDLLAFYAHKYSLNVLANCTARILKENHGKMQDKRDLDVILVQIGKLRSIKSNLKKIQHR
ncbi:MAG: aminoglycoside phosphotransferase family protein [Candidatus Goldiibacteriota bacterium]